MRLVPLSLGHGGSNQGYTIHVLPYWAQVSVIGAENAQD